MIFLGASVLVACLSFLHGYHVLSGSCRNTIVIMLSYVLLLSAFGVLLLWLMDEQRGGLQFFMVCAMVGGFAQFGKHKGVCKLPEKSRQEPGLP